MVGDLPDAAGALPLLRQVAVDGTGLSCVPGDVALAQQRAAEANAAALRRGRAGGAGGEGRYYRCGDGEHLPCFLDFAPYYVPRSDASGMACRPVVRRRPRDAPPGCAPPAGGEQAPRDAPPEHWDLPPAYFQYYACQCLEGYIGTWSRNHTVLACDPKPRGAGGLPAWAWALVALAGALALLAAALALLGSRVSNLRSRWVREAEHKRKRRAGPPRGGSRASVVVTDIEGYSRESPGG